MSRTLIVSTGVAAVAALVAWRYLPARAIDDSENASEPFVNPAPSAPWYVRACTCSYGYARTYECVAGARDEEASCPCVPAAACLSDLPPIGDDRVRMPTASCAGTAV